MTRAVHVTLPVLLILLQIPVYTPITLLSQPIKSLASTDSAKSEYSSAASLFRNPNQTDSNCDGYTMFFEDVSLVLFGIDSVIFVTDFIPLTIETFIAIWDFLVFYILGLAFNYVDLQSIALWLPSPGSLISIIVTLISLLTVLVDFLLFRPITSVIYLWYYISESFGNLSLAVAIISQFEEEILGDMLGIRGTLRHYLRNYNDCYNSKLRQMSMSTNQTLMAMEASMPTGTAQMIVVDHT